MPRSFVEQAIARCSVSGSRLWFNCNPEGPQHWFYQEWILKCAQRNALYLHFTMEDNPALSQRIRQRYRASYSARRSLHWNPSSWSTGESSCKRFLRRLTTLFPQKANCFSQRIRQRYRASYSGAFYRRFILGEWTAAKGLIYDFFDPARDARPAPEGELEE